MPHRAGLSAETLVNAAMKIADGEGIKSLTLSRLAREFGVKSPSLYEHIDGIDGLLRLLRLKGLELMGRQFQSAVMGISGDEAIGKLADSFRSFAEEYPSLYDLTVESDKEDSEEVKAASREILNVIYAVLNNYGLSDTMAIHATRYLRSVIHGFISLEKSGGFGIEVSIDESFIFVKKALVSTIKIWSK